jgi:cysteinyl-tRNA synthetase
VQLDTARAALDSYYTALRGMTPDLNADGGEFEARFRAAMDDDFSTPEALAVLADVRHALNRARDKADDSAAAQAAGVLVRLAGMLGILQADAEEWLTGADSENDLDAGAIDDMVTARNAARADKNWAEADRIRDALLQQGIVIEDGAAGTSWRRV